MHCFASLEGMRLRFENNKLQTILFILMCNTRGFAHWLMCSKHILLYVVCIWTVQHAYVHGHFAPSGQWGSEMS